MRPSNSITATLLITITLVSFGCFKMDSLLYNPEVITEYNYQNSDFDWAWDYPETYRTADSMWHPLTVTSTIPEEGSSETIHAVYVGDPSRIATDTVIVFCHGNSRHIDAYVPWIVMLANVGGQHRYGVLAMDYRGYGLSTGTPSEEGMYADVTACIDWLAERGLTSDRFAIFGQSLGTASATELTANPRSLEPSWLILEAPFASAEMIGQSSTNLNMPSGFFTQLQIDNAEEIKKVEQPFLWIHGTADDFLDYEAHGQTVWNNYSGSRGLAVPVEGARHSDPPAIYGLSNYIETISGFIQNR